MYFAMYADTYVCNHPVYKVCTLFKINEKGLAVIQQRYDPDTKTIYWSSIATWLAELYLHENIEYFFNERVGKPIDGLYPTVTIRQIM